MKKAFIEKIKLELLERQQKIEEELKKIADKNPEVSDEDYVTKFPQLGDDLEDSAEEIPVYEQNLAIEQSLESSLRDIHAALKRIDEGTYGVCKYCHKEIDEKRLLARPVSSSCMACKSRIQKA